MSWNSLYSVSKILPLDWEKSAEEVLSGVDWKKGDILHSYIVPEYEMLHTQSKDYIIDDIIGLMEERGIQLWFYIMAPMWMSKLQIYYIPEKCWFWTWFLHNTYLWTGSKVVWKIQASW